jgi:outer membrane protein TolC
VFIKFRHASLIFIFLSILDTQSWAASLTLSECIQKAKNNNPTLKNSAWDVRIAQENARQVAAAYLPRVDAQIGYSMQLEPQAVIISGHAAETQEPDFAFANLAATYTIYDFGRRDARKDQAGAYIDAATQLFEAKRSEIALQVIETYFGILESDKLFQAATEEIAQVEEHRRVAQVLFEEGVVTRNDVLQADVRLAAARQKLLAVRNRRENIRLQLDFLTGNQGGLRSDLDDSATVTNDVQTLQHGNLNLSRRHDIQALQHNLQASVLCG